MNEIFGANVVVVVRTGSGVRFGRARAATGSEPVEARRPSARPTATRRASRYSPPVATAPSVQSLGKKKGRGRNARVLSDTDVNAGVDKFKNVGSGGGVRTRRGAATVLPSHRRPTRVPESRPPPPPHNIPCKTLRHNTKKGRDDVHTVFTTRVDSFVYG